MEDKRISISIPSDIIKDMKELKKEVFYDRTYAEMYRFLFRVGLEAIKKENQ